MGIYLGKISNFNNNKGHISFTTQATVNIGDKICVENKKHETSIYTISELMINNKNIKQAKSGDSIKIGRMKGNLSIGDKIFKLSDKTLSAFALDTLNIESKKINLNCKLIVKKATPISITISDSNNNEINIVSETIPVDAINSPITKERLISQLSKTNDTPFKFTNFAIDLDDGLYIPNISSINELRRQSLHEFEKKIISSLKRELPILPKYDFNSKNINIQKKSISILLNILNLDFDYLKLKNIDKIYIPFKYFTLKKYSNILKDITSKFNTYIYMPVIIRENYNNLIKNNLPNILENFNIKGFVISNLGNLELLHKYKNNYKFICNYTLNIFNDLTLNELNCSTVTLSPELNKIDIENINNLNKCELIVYGKTPLMNSNYCLLGKSNKCYASCDKKCNSNNKYYIKDRLGFLFRVIPDNIQTITTIYNSKTTSIEHTSLPVNSIRIDILDESIEEINNIIRIVSSGNKLEGNDYTNGNLNKTI